MEKYKAYTSIDADTSKQTVFDANTVFIRENFKKIDANTYEYDETVYFIGEYVSLLQTKVKELDEKNRNDNSTQDDLILDNAYRVAMLELNSPAQATI